MELDAYLADLASAAPTPGGGSAAALCGAFAAALVAMVARITATNPAHAVHAPETAAIVAAADALRGEFERARPADEAAYAAVVQATARPKATPAQAAERRERLQRALAGAASAPLHTAELALDALRLTERARALGNRHLASDVDCAAIFARAALAAAAANVRVNHAYLKDPAIVAAQQAALGALEAAADGFA